MRMRRRWLQLVMVVSVTTMLATPAIASEESPAAKPAETDDSFCIYTQGRTDTPETGPLPCDTSRPYMSGHSGFSRSPSSEPVDGTSASPAMPDGNPNRSMDSQAP